MTEEFNFVKRATTVVLLLIAAFIISAEAAERPKLVIYISVDQMKAEYFEWYRAEFTGGFARFLRNGTVFSNADLNHAPSETGPGHASLGTGDYPSHNGIPSNEWIDPRSGILHYCVEDPTAGKVDGEGGGASPRNLVVTGLADWWKAAIPDSKVISASIKDRASILMGGLHPDYAFWYDEKTGHMVTSDYYIQHLPEWVKSFNTEEWPEHTMPDTWTKLLSDSVYTKYGPDQMQGEQETDGSTSFPHSYPRAKKKSLLPSSPFGDVMVLDFARTAVRSEKLGQRGPSDLLIISLSCTDYVGHAYGPNSHELIDQLIRLDRALGSFFDDMEKTVGAGNVLIVLSSDHAVLPLPEYLSAVKHVPARRVLVQNEIYPRIDALDRKLQKELGTTEHIIKWNAFLNYSAASTAGIDSMALERRVKAGLLRIDGIAGVFFRRDILDPSNGDKPFVGYYQKGYFPSRGRDFMVLPHKNYLFTTSPTGTTHGTPYSYDTHVPMLFLGKGIKRGTIATPAHTVDIAPTIARLLGIPFPMTVDGVPRKEIVK